ncbi:hypothetical protein TNCV_4651151 [Trichonephila clavipes]|nr:hypothetical protein TNCV_4651151 [Trichonephila clavipes]
MVVGERDSILNYARYMQTTCYCLKQGSLESMVQTLKEGTGYCNIHLLYRNVWAVILAPDEGGVEMSWKSSGGTNAGEAIEIGETVGVRACLSVGVALCLLAISVSF